MQCMKCGRDVEPGQVFCENCHEQMEKYPVKPGTVVILPRSPQYHQQPKRQPVRIVPADEQIRTLKKRNRILSWCLALTAVVSVLSAWTAICLRVEYEGKYLPGQNYSTVGSKDETEPEETTLPAETAEDDMFHVKQG